MNKDNKLIFEAYLESTEQQPVMTTNKYGDKQWMLNGQLHRLDGPAVEDIDGFKEWWVNGERHREGAPAITYPGSEEWYKNGKMHRIDGPAAVYGNGDMHWYVDGKLYSDKKNWACAALEHQGKPADPDSVENYLRTILQKQTKDLI